MITCVIKTSSTVSLRSRSCTEFSKRAHESLTAF